MNEKDKELEFSVYKRFLALLFAGFFIILFGAILLVAAAMLSEGGDASFGGVIFIWFFPIVFGAGPQASWLILFAIILAVLSIVMFFIMRKEWGKASF
ncbi:MAG: DUF131 domain-containing protein [Candidatus Bathyarchaeia archaeon]